MPKRLWTEELYEYGRALRNAPQLVHRIAFRPRTIEEELVEASLKGSLRRVLGAYDLMSLGLGFVIGSGVFLLTGPAALTAGPAVVISYVISGVVIILASVCYAEFAMEYPVAGAGFTYIMLTFGELPAWLAVTNLMLQYVMGTAAIARGFSLYLARICQLDDDHFLVDGTQIDIMAFGIVLVVTAVLSSGVRESGYMITALNTIHLLLLATVTIGAYTQADTDNLTPFVLGGVDNVLESASLVFFALVGFDVVASAAEEARKPEHIPWALVGTTVVATVTYVLMSLGLVMMYPIPWQPPTNEAEKELQLNYRNAAFSTTFRTIGMESFFYITCITALIGIITALLVGLYGAGRVVMVAARDWLMPPFLASIYPRTQTPLIATVVVGCVTALVAMFTPYVTLSDLVSAGTVLVMWLVANALLFRRYYPGSPRLRYSRWGIVEAAEGKTVMPFAVPGSQLKLTMRARQWLVVGHLLAINAVCIGATIYYQIRTLCVSLASVQCYSDYPNWEGTIAWIAVWIALTLSMQMLCPLEYEPPKWHVPWWLMPWLPSFTIFMLIFTVGSIDDRKIFWIFGCWLLGVLAVYFLFSLPMSYIKHYKLDYVHSEQMNVVELSYRNGRWVPVRYSGHGPHMAPSHGPSTAHLDVTSVAGSTSTPKAGSSQVPSQQSLRLGGSDGLASARPSSALPSGPLPKVATVDRARSRLATVPSGQLPPRAPRPSSPSKVSFMLGSLAAGGQQQQQQQQQQPQPQQQQQRLQSEQLPLRPPPPDQQKP